VQLSLCILHVVVPRIGSVSLAWQKMDLRALEIAVQAAPNVLPSRAAERLSLVQSADCLEGAKDCSASWGIMRPADSPSSVSELS
jgi:hypothetical protein